MIKNIYQLAYELNCNELYFLRERKHMQGEIVKGIMKKRCEATTGGYQNGMRM